MALSTINSSGLNQDGNTVLCTTSGNVGIGTSSPAANLEVFGATRKVRISDGTNTLDMGQWDGATNRIESVGRSLQLIQYGASNTISFATNATERARIDSSGNLLVGTTSNSTGARIAVSGSGTGGAYLLRLASSATGGSTADGLEFVFGDGVAKGSIRWNSTITAYNTSSDYRLKNTIAPMTGALAKVALLKPCTYKWNVDGSDGEGFIAHELAEVVPGCVTGDKDAVDADGNPQYQGIDTSFLVATLTAAIQELKAIVDAQSAEIAALKGEA